MLAILRDHRGFTIGELVVATAILGLLAGGLLQVQQVSLDTFVRASSSAEAQGESRAGIDQIAGELAQAGAYYTGATGAGNAITAATATSITFLGDVDGDTLDATGTELRLAADPIGAVLTVDRATTALSAGEWVYLGNGLTREVRQVLSAVGTVVTLTSAPTNAFPAGSIVRSVETVTYTITGNNVSRALNGGAAETLVGNAVGLTFTYFDAAGTQLSASPVVTTIREVRVSLTNTAPGGRPGRVMTVRVRPRSLGLGL
ncbi:MAG TPA: prepilin-type N-terminal cleavage/methylation domain-containing protein [Methylomirabilota bacterium]|nr:prepilin-type N-terminal cleavage/methylation domain-containing protein [Methylomirabilota bacterium]